MGWCISAESKETLLDGYEVTDSRTGTTSKRGGGAPQWFPGAQNVAQVTIPLGMSLPQIVQSIIRAKPTGEHISKLRLGCHGKPGKLLISGQDHVPVTVQNADAFRPLREHFKLLSPGGDNYGVILVHACSIAECSDDGTSCGLELMQRIAAATNTPVQAPFDLQSMSGTNFNGPTLWVYPNGSYTVV